MKQLKAFTLLELLIAMIISSIVIGFCYMSYSILYKQFAIYKASRTELTEIIQLHSVLDNDFSNAETVSYNEPVLLLKDGHLTQLYYEFRDGYVLRKTGELTDTFHIAAARLIPAYIREEKNTMINSLSFEADFWGKTERFVYHANYSAATMMKNFSAK